MLCYLHLASRVNSPIVWLKAVACSLIIFLSQPAVAAMGVQDPITMCSDAAFVVQNASPNRQLFSVDTSTNPVGTTALVFGGDPPGMATEYNAMGMIPYNSEDPMDNLSTVDGFLYAIQVNAMVSEIIRIDSEGEVFNLGAPSPAGGELTLWPADQIFNLGAMDSGNTTLYVTDTSLTRLFRIDLETLTYTTVAITGVTIDDDDFPLDWGFNPHDRQLYGIARATGDFVIVDPVTGAASTRVITGGLPAGMTAADSYGAVWFDQTGDFYAYRNGSGGFGEVYQVELDPNGDGILDDPMDLPVFVTSRTAPESTSNDGAPCLLYGQTPFLCQGQALMVQDSPAGGIDGLLTEIVPDLTTPELFDFDFEEIGLPQVEYNAIGFRRTDNFIYGLELFGTGNQPGNEGLIRVDANGQAIEIVDRTTLGLPNRRIDGGTISPDGRFMFVTQGLATDPLHIIDLANNPDPIVILSTGKSGGNGSGGGVFDWAMSPDDFFLYGADRDDGQLSRMDPLTAAITQVAVAGCDPLTPPGGGCDATQLLSGGPPIAYGGAWFDAVGNLFVYENGGNDPTGGSIFEIDLTGGPGGTPIIVSTQSGPGSTRNDATACIALFTRALVSDFRVELGGSELTGGLSGVPVVRWQTDSERGTAGFYVEREDTQTGRWIRLNNQLLPGLLDAPQGGDYALVDEKALVGQRYRYRVIEQEVWGTQRISGPFSVTVGDSSVEPITRSFQAIDLQIQPAWGSWRRLAAGYSARAKQLPGEADVARSLLVNDEGLVLTQGLNQGAEVNHRTRNLQKAKTLRLPADRSGLYRVKKSDLKRLKGKGNRYIINNADGPVPYYAQGKYLYFVGEAYADRETDENVYLLSKGKGRGQVMKRTQGRRPRGTGPTSAVFREVVRAEEDERFFPWLVRTEGSDYAFGDFLYWPAFGVDEDGDDVIDRDSNQTTQRLVLPGASATGLGLLRVELQGANEAVAGDEHEVTASINGQLLEGSTAWSGVNRSRLEVSFDQSLLTDLGDGSREALVTLEQVGLNGTPYSLSYLDFIEVEYDRHYQALDDELWVHGSISGLVTVRGFSSRQIRVIEDPNGDRPRWRRDIRVKRSGGSWQVSYKARGGLDYLVTAAVHSVGLETVEESNLRHPDVVADYLIIAPQSLSASAQALSDYRSSSYATEVVWLQDIYDEFNVGRTSSGAIEGFLDYVHGHWPSVPRYVVLLGQGTTDHRDVLGYGDSVLPLRLMLTHQGLVGSDNSYADVDGDGVPDYLLGRISASTEVEGLGYVSKLQSYEQSGGTGSDRVALVADDVDLQSGDFHSNSAVIAAQAQEYGYGSDRLFHPLEPVREELLSGWQSGSYGYINYVGHGGRSRLGDEGYMTLEDVGSLDTGVQPVVFTAWTCVVGESYPGGKSLADALSMTASGGSVGGVAPTALSLDHEAHGMNRGFVEGLLGEGETLGEAFLRSHQDERLSDTHRAIYQIQGDPALRLQ